MSSNKLWLYDYDVEVNGVPTAVLSTYKLRKWLQESLDNVEGVRSRYPLDTYGVGQKIVLSTILQELAPIEAIKHPKKGDIDGS